MRMAIFTTMKLEYHVLGVMSGTSLDGIDIAEINFRYNGGWQYEMGKAETLPYSDRWQKILAGAVFYGPAELEDLNKQYTLYLAGILKDFIRRHGIQNLDAICGHGHTVKHEPQKGFTLQIGNQPALATLVRQKVVCDFRVQDVELGGQGAPLVPIGDELLFGEYDYCLNLGGFANVSTNIGGKRIAYDLCAVNIVLNNLAFRLGFAYDKNGSFAKEGSLDQELLQKLNALEFYKVGPPKSLGVEWVNQQILPLLKNYKNVSAALHTYAVHAAQQITAAFDDDPASKVLVTGGGTFNNFLMDQLKQLTRCQIVIPEPEVVNFKEALIFGLLGVLRLRGEINVLASVTGAARNHSSGRIF